MDNMNPKPEEQFVVRLWDMFDGWIDVKGPCSKAEAEAYWNEQTDQGKHSTQYSDGDYWKIFPADTQMYYTPERMGR